MTRSEVVIPRNKWYLFDHRRARSRNRLSEKISTNFKVISNILFIPSWFPCVHPPTSEISCHVPLSCLTSSPAGRKRAREGKKAKGLHETDSVWRGTKRVYHYSNDARGRQRWQCKRGRSLEKERSWERRGGAIAYKQLNGMGGWMDGWMDGVLQ